MHSSSTYSEICESLSAPAYLFVEDDGILVSYMLLMLGKVTLLGTNKNPNILKGGLKIMIK